MRPSHLSWLAAPLLAGALGCHPAKDPVETLCDLIFSCDCEGIIYPDVDTCVTSYNTRYDQQRTKDKEAAANYGLTYDQACFDRVLALEADALGCSDDLTAIGTCHDYCSPVHGDKAIGTPCADYGDSGSDCAGNLVCLDNTCIDPCDLYPTAGLGESCTGGATCDEGLYCDAADTGACQKNLGAGDPCPNFNGCAPGLICNPTAVCQPLPAEGEACFGACAEGLVCDASLCKIGPGEGEPCASFQCGPGLSCDPNTDLCAAPEPFVCQLGRS